MLAALYDYTFLWQLPVIFLFIAAWLVGGGYLLYWSLRKLQATRRVKLRRCVLGIFLAGAIALAGAAVTYLLISAIGSTINVDLNIPAALLAIPVAGITAHFVISAMFDFSLRVTVRAAAPTFISILLLVASFSAVTFPVAWHQRHRNLKRDRSIGNLRKIHGAVELFYRRFSKQPPTLQVLVDQDILKADELRAETAPDRQIGFFYVPIRTKPNQTPTDRILACDLPTDPQDSGRIVLSDNGDCYCMIEEEFLKLLEDDRNAAFAKQFAERR